ncbi:hypothetical protein HELRODRAFT_169165 [Helobdella robusta]|uniref:Uncharacterized protein n=1 Tax=Helobdella robusta TaxID=6412 RepID=T1F1I4_HELRO|nr:hypothetical protein HELRODRAFT_169165 [Helobdella robusta]ESO08352.1 hypothetical protein HELRODRAFT_169165 [Helobdella robusta]
MEQGNIKNAMRILEPMALNSADRLSALKNRHPKAPLDRKPSPDKKPTNDKGMLLKYQTNLAGAMVRKYKQTSERGKYGDELLATGLQTIANGKSLILVSQELSIPARTSQR